TKELLLGAAYDPCFVSLLNHLIFLPFLLLGLLLVERVGCQIRLALLAKKVQIDRIENDATLWGVSSHCGNMPCSKVAATQDSRVESVSVFPKIFANTLEIRMIDNLHS